MFGTLLVNDAGSWGPFTESFFSRAYPTVLPYFVCQAYERSLKLDHMMKGGPYVSH